MTTPKTLRQLLGTSSKGPFDDDMPELREGQSRDFVVDGHHLRVTATSELGIDTGRRRYRVECLTCGEIVHEATTGPRWNMARHPRWAAEDAAMGAAKKETP